MEGHLPCVKFLVSEGPSPTHILGARNDNGETPKMLSQQFYKDHVVEYITNIEWERDHPEEAESESCSGLSIYSIYVLVSPKLFYESSDAQINMIT